MTARSNAGSVESGSSSSSAAVSVTPARNGSTDDLRCTPQVLPIENPRTPESSGSRGVDEALRSSRGTPQSDALGRGRGTPPDRDVSRETAHGAGDAQPRGTVPLVLAAEGRVGARAPVGSERARNRCKRARIWHSAERGGRLHSPSRRSTEPPKPSAKEHRSDRPTRARRSTSRRAESS